MPVYENQTTSAINFDLNRGVLFTGRVFENSTGKPISYQFLDLSFYDAFSNEYFITSTAFLNIDGSYGFSFDKTGLFKILCETKGYESQFYNNTSFIAEATILQIISLNQTFENFDFHLNKKDSINFGSISGMIYKEGTLTPLELVEVLAVNVDDTTIWGSTFSMFETGINQSPPAGSYIINELAVGKYVVSAYDFCNGHMREFYDNKEFPRDATQVSVFANETTKNIDFTLSKAGTITGTITNYNNQFMDSAYVLAFKSDKIYLSAYDIIDKLKKGNLYLGFTDSQGRYEITDLSDGNYAIRTFSYLYKPGQYLDEYYDRIISIEPGFVVEKIDFQLDSAGSIHGKLVDSSGESITSAINAFAFNLQTNNYEYFTHFKIKDNTYQLSGLDNGLYSVFFDIATNEESYISEFYDNYYKYDFKGVDYISVNKGNATENINVTIDIGGVIEGTVSLNSGKPIGVDTLYQSLLILYDNVDGAYIRDLPTTFCGGYHIKGIPPGAYKLCVLPLVRGNASTYFGGGGTFDDPESELINVQANLLSVANIQIDTANGNISGVVTKEYDQQPLNLVYILVYDPSGHAVSAGISGVEFCSDIILDDGFYTINCLRNGTYYLRSWFLTTANPYSQNLHNDEYEYLFDEWYNNITIETASAEYGDNFLPNFPEISSNNLFFQSIPDQASPVIISTDHKIIDAINFVLSQKSQTNIKDSPTLFLKINHYLLQNYPNPFNSSTTINYLLSQKANVKLSIFDLMGKKIKTLVSDSKNTGSYNVIWNGTTDQGQFVVSGIYFISLEITPKEKGRIFQQVHKMIIVR